MKFNFFPLILFASILVVATSCNRDHDGFEERIVMIDANGNVSNGARFVGIDESNFYINDIKYSVVGGHLEVTGYDKGFSGTAEIFSGVAYHSNNYRVLAIANGAFSGCEALKAVSFPDGITSIGARAFSGCISLLKVNIPASVTVLGNGAFEYCSNIVEVSLGSEMKSIGDGAFSGCEALKAVSLPDGITSIGDQAFSGCISLLKVNVPASVTVLGDGAFEYCSNMVEVSLGSEVKSIGDGAFRGCQSLEGIHIGNQDPPQLGESCFMDSGGCPIYVPDESIKKYLSDGSWQVYRKRIYGEKSKKSAIDFKGIVVSVNGVEFSMIAVEGGTFLMGSPDDDVETYGNEKPQHQVTLSDYYIGETEVTQELWEAVMGSNPPYYDGYPQRPVVYVTWNDCQTFIQKLNALTGKKFRLPTEAEREFAGTLRHERQRLGMVPGLVRLL